MTNKTIVAISGKIGSGKSTLARKLYNKLRSDSIIIIPFAGDMKRCVEIITGIGMTELQPDGSYDYSRDQKRLVTDFNRSLGQFVCDFAEKSREIDPLLWIKALDKNIRNAQANIIIIPDMRTKAEYNYVTSHPKHYTIRLLSSFTVPEDGRDVEHTTETGLDDPDLYFDAKNRDGVSPDMLDFMVAMIMSKHENNSGSVTYQQ